MGGCGDHPPPGFPKENRLRAGNIHDYKLLIGKERNGQERNGLRNELPSLAVRVRKGFRVE
jgi:hypothetical protein